ncbi:MAG: polymer-forming cytoskeletal protein [Clostridia bacterium]|nr:polymer-forming cytoskeletal protein [Clostridia bacterium]
MDMKIAGSGVLNGGEYDAISISGSAKITGDIRCAEFKCAGAVKANGDLHSTGDIRVSGSFSCDGTLIADGVLKVAGSCHTEQKIKGKEIRIAGALTTRGNITGEIIRSSGSIRTDGDVEGEEIVLTGGAKIGGTLNGEQVSLYPDGDGGIMQIPTIGGTTIEVQGKGPKSFFQKLFYGKKCNTLRAELIEGDTVKLQDTQCDIVRGTNITVGPNCKIRRIEYAETLTVDAESQVEEQAKL